VIFVIDGRISIGYIDLEANERGIKTLYKRCNAEIEATDEADAQEQFRRAAVHAHPGCWELIVREFVAVPLEHVTANEPR
jgi:hypothetical protein